MDPRALSVLLLLVCVQWAHARVVRTGLTDPPIILDDDLVPQEQGFPLSEHAGVLYQGDMMLTDEQWRSLLQRKAIADERYRWPKSANGTVNIDYRYNDTIVSRPGVQKALSTWESATCVRFREIPSAVAKPHLIFKTSDLFCSSAVGYIFYQNGQDINLKPTCFNDDDTPVHELGHSLGLWHEQSRSDRDDYVTITIENVIPGKEHNFNKEITNNYGVPYDYSSVMHYIPTAFTKNESLYTIITKDPLALPLTKDSKGLAFMDKKIINIMYNCTGTWLAACRKTTDPCRNQGYTNSQCKCECPLGTAGVNCETLNLPYTDALINATSPGFQRITTKGTVTSPGYPTPVTGVTQRVQSIEAPTCHKVKLTFTVFNMQGLSNLSYSNVPNSSFQACWFMILDIKLDDPPITGKQYCGGDIIAPQTFESKGRFMILTYSTKALASNTKTGYSATVEFVPVTSGNCTIPSPGKIINSGRLIIDTSTYIGPCILHLYINSHPTRSVHFYYSPNYPSNYGKGQQCTVWFNTTEPRYLKVTPVILSLGSSDKVDLLSAYNTTTVIDATKVGTEITLPTTSSRLSFLSSTSSPGGKFNISVEVVNTGCHQLILLEAGSTGTLTIPPNYPAGTICEWWLRAPVGRNVQVSFSSFSIGTLGSTCLRDSVVIDVTGDTRYVHGAKNYCGANVNSPGTVKSIANALNILVNGQWGNYQGLTATYTVV